MSLTENDKDLETFIPTGKKVVISGIEFEIKPFVLRNRIKAVKIIVDIMKDVGAGMTSEIQKDPMKAIPVLVEAAGERLKDLYVLVLGKDEDWCLDNIQPKNEVEILATIFEVNDIPFIVRRIQEAMPKVIASK